AEAGRASTAKNVSAVQAKWLWASMKPGTTVRPATSIASAAGPAAVTTSASSPAATIRPARIATAPAVGRRGSQVTTWPFRRTSPRSEPSTVHLANESKGDTSVPCGEAQRAAPKEEDTVTGRSKRLFGLVATAGLILSACTSGGGANSQVPTVSGTTASVAPTGAPPSTAASPSAVAITAPTSLLKAGELSNCVDIEYSPMEFFAPSDPNTPVGFDVESYQSFVKKPGLTEKIVNTGFDGLIPALTAGRCDIVWTALYINEDRLKVADAVPYFKSSHQVMVPAGNPKGVKSEMDLCGLKISIQSGGLVEKVSKTASDACVAA